MSVVRALIKGFFYLVNRCQLTDHLLQLPFEKRDRLANIVRATGAVNFVETGTFHGETTRHIAPLVSKVYSMEIDAAAARVARQNCAAFPNVRIIEEPSEIALSTVLREMSGVTLFWLDAHYQLGMTRGKQRCPLFNELDAIFAATHIEPVIMIDDARKFLGVNGWPSLASIQRYVARHAPGLSLRVSQDMIAIGRFSM
jgi:hypothetical protein